MSVYERTSHELAMPKEGQEQENTSSTATTSSSSSSNVTLCCPILTDDKTGIPIAFCLKNFLTAFECQDIIDQSERLGLEDSGYCHSMRKCDRRAATASPELAQTLFERALPFLTSFDLNVTNTIGPSTFDYPRGISPMVEPSLWIPTHINRTLRVCRYEPGGFFLPHHDGGFQEHDHCLSLQTLMIYLNGDFDGGETNFYNDQQEHYQEPHDSMANLVYSYNPQRGDALIFNSEITHDGRKLQSKRKYILRSEIMYSVKK